MDKLPKTTFVYCLETEAERVLFTSKVLTEGFYQRHRFRVVPKLKPGMGVETVVIPDLPYREVDQFWLRAAKLKRQFPLRVSKRLLSRVGYLVKAEGPVSQSALERKRKVWNGVESEFWHWLDQLFPKLYRQIGELEVRLTRYGTASSYSYLGEQENQKLIIYWRLDQDLDQLLEAIITGVFQPVKHKYWLSWSLIEGAVDLLLSESRLARHWNEHMATLKHKAESVGQDLATRRYLDFLGVPMSKRDVELNGRRMYVLGKTAEGWLTEREELIMSLLLREEGVLVGFDEVMDSVWGEGGGSVWALNKLVQRIRHKLTDHGVDGSRLKTVRKRSYVWLQE